MRVINIKIADCSGDTLVRTAKRCGFVILRGRKHNKVKTPDGKFVTMIPRHNRLKRETVKVVVDALRKFGAPVASF